MQKGALAIVGILDAGDEEQAGLSIRALEAQIEQIFVIGIQRDVEGRLNRLHTLLDATA